MACAQKVMLVCPSSLEAAMNHRKLELQVHELYAEIVIFT